MHLPLRPIVVLLLAAHALRAQRLIAKTVDSIVTRALKTFPTPGVSIVVIQDGKVVVAKGYGVKKLGDTARVTPRTRFGIASNTKIFTATALGILVEEGKLEWDAPVTRYLPQFAMYDPFVTREMTVRDLLVHRSGLGLGAGDLLWWPASTYDRKEIMRRLRFIKPAKSFRAAYAYDNVLYLVAGEVIEAVSGMSWERFVDSRILQKVGMTSSTTGHSDAGKPGDVATTHTLLDGVEKVIAPMTSDNTNPAGGINSGAEDMAKWVMTELDSGKLADGSRLFRATTARQLWAPVTPMPSGTPPQELAPLKLDFNFYALGLGVLDYRGRMTLHHTGGLPGYLSAVTLVPSARAAVVVLTNDESSTFLALNWALLDRALNAPPHDWIASYAALEARQKQMLAASAKGAQAARDSAAKPSLALEKYAGAYEDAWYGDVSVAYEKGGLVMRFSHTPQLTGDLVPWQHETFLVRWRDRELRADAYATFALTADGHVDQIKLLPASPDVDFSFDFADLLLTPKRAMAPTQNDYADGSAWLCRPGRKDACAVDLRSTVIGADGAFSREIWAPDPNAPLDCFYVYPTVSADSSMNSGMIAGASELNVIRQQFARFGSKCRTFAPLYRQVTLAGLNRILPPADSAGSAMSGRIFAIAYNDVRDAWRYYIAHDNNGRGVVLIGHSQGSLLLAQLIRNEIDGSPLQARLVSAIIPGTDIAVPKDRDVGGSFQHVPLCRAATQTGCVIAYVSFRSTSPPPANPFFGRVAGAGMVNGCTNPAALAGGSGKLHSYFASTTRGLIGTAESRAWVVPARPIETPFISVPGMLTAKCASNENASGYLEIIAEPSPSGANHDDIGGELRMGGRVLTTWGLHIIDVNIALGNLVEIVGEQSRAYLAKTRAP